MGAVCVAWLPMVDMENASGADAGEAVAGPDPPAGGEPPLSVQMTRLLTGFEVSQALYAMAKLDVATAMLTGPAPVGELAARTDTHTESLRRMLRSLTAIGVVSQEGDDVFAVTPLGATLASGSPGSVRDLAVMLMETHYAPFGQFADTVRTGAPAATLYYGQPFIDWVSADTQRAESFSAAMAAMTDSLQGDVFAGYRLPGGDIVVDLGGADGSVLLRLLRDEPHRRGASSTCHRWPRPRAPASPTTVSPTGWT